MPIQTLFDQFIPVITIISVFLGILISLWSLRDKFFIWLRNDIGNYWQIQDMYAIVLELKISEAIDTNDKIEFILELYEEYKHIPQSNGKERNGRVKYKINEYFTKQNINHKL